MCNKCALQNRQNHFISDAWNTEIRAARNMFLKPLSYGTLLSRKDVAGSNNDSQRVKEMAVVQGRLLKDVTSNHLLAMSWLRTSSNMNGCEWTTETVQDKNCCAHCMKSIRNLTSILTRAKTVKSILLFLSFE